MNKFGKILALAVAFGVLAVLLSLLSNGRAGASGPPNGLDVNVVNTPLPVTGTFSGTANVNVTNTAASPTLVRDVDNPAHHIFRVSSQCVLAAAQTICSASFSVPANQMLVIETVSAIVNVPMGQKVQVQWQLGPYFFHRPPLQPLGTFGGIDYFSALIPARLYGEPGSNVTVTVQRDDNTGAGFLNSVTSGYLVDCGAGSGCPLP